MEKIAVIGNSEFNLGFMLAGITDTFEVDRNSDPLKAVREAMSDPSINIVIMDERLVSRIEPNERRVIEDSVKPVFITLSAESTQEGLKNMIKKSIGIDLWKGD